MSPRSPLARLRPLAPDLAAIALAAAVALVRPPAALVERIYSNGAYPAIDRAVRALDGRFPLCLGDVLLVVALALLGGYWAVSLRAGGARAIPRALLRTAAGAAVLFLWFMASWAYGYDRVPLARTVVVHDARTDEDTVAAFANRVSDELTRNAAPAHREALAEADTGAALAPTFESAIRRLGDAASFAPPHVKPTIFQPFFELSATSGFTDPWTHEVNLDESVSRFERPAILAHEWAHVAGFTDESEANYVAVLACIRAPRPLLRYSGWLLVWFNLPADVKVTHPLSRLAYDDLTAIRDRILAHRNRQVEHVSQLAYDQYLKSNHVKAGYASYRLFVRWLVGGDYDRDGLPIVRAAG